MFFVERDSGGRVEALFRNKPRNDTEELPADHPGIVDFLTGGGGGLAPTSLEMLQESGLKVGLVVDSAFAEYYLLPRLGSDRSTLRTLSVLGEEISCSAPSPGECSAPPMSAT